MSASWPFERGCAIIPSRLRALSVALILVLTIFVPQVLHPEIRFAPRAEGADETSLAPMIERVPPGTDLPEAKVTPEAQRPEATDLPASKG